MTEDLFADMRARVLRALRAVVPDLPAEVAERVEVTPAREPAHGDMATNAALVAAKGARQVPRRLAEAIVAELGKNPDVPGVAEVAGPGFVNIRLRVPALQAVLPVILRAGEAYGDGAKGGPPVNIEYVSTNPTGPMHVAHCRGAVVGDALANLLRKAGHAVTKE